MPAQIINLTDTFDEWRIKTNTIATLAFTSLQDVIDDTTPQLGGNLDLNSNDITGTGNINFTGILTSTSIAGTVVGTTQSAGTNSTLLATTAFVHSVVASEDTLAEDNDVTISGLANLDLLQYDSGTSRWVNTAIGATTQSAGTNSTLLATTAFVHSVVASEDTLLEMNDTTISNPQNLDILQYTGSVWENQVLSITGVTEDDATALAIALGG